jgi:APA family basic amino acid/polyamine antiporter
MGEGTPATARPGLTPLRSLGQWDLTAIGVNQVVGAGIFVLPAAVAALVGQAASPLVWVVAAAVNALIILCFAEAGTRFRDAGGPYLYAKAAFGPFVGFEVAWMMFLTRATSQAALANGFALYLGYFWGGATSGAGRVLVLVALIGLLAAINYRGVRHGSWTVDVFTVGKLIPLLGFVVLGLWYVDPGRFSGVLEPRLEGFGQATLLLMYAYGGYELVPIPAGEAKSPVRGVPRALLTTIGLCTCLYLLVQVVAVGTLDDLAGSQAPLADAASSFLGPATGIVIALGGLISIGGSNAGTMLAAPRLLYALAEQKQLPRLFGRLHPEYRTPHVSIFVYSLFSLILALTGSFIVLAAVSAMARMAFYTTTCAAIPILRGRGTSTEGAFRLPGGAVIPVLATCASLAVIAGADSTSLRAGAAALVAGAVFYWVLRRPFAGSG